MKTRTIAFTAAAIGFFAVALASPVDAQDRPAIGTTAPGFTLSTIEGEPVSLAAMRERGPVVLIQMRGFFSPDFQCPYCTAQVGEFMNRMPEFQAAGANIIPVYPGPSEGLKARAEDFVRGKQLPGNFYLVLDPEYRFTNAYGLRWNAPNETAYPATFLVDQGGVIRYANISQTHGDRAGADDLLALLR